MAYCKHCDKEIEPLRDGKRHRCPDCHLYVKVSEDEKSEPLVEEIKDEIEQEEELPKTPGRPKKDQIIMEGTKKLLPTSKTISYDAADLHMGEILINLGYAKDLNDLTRKNMKLAFSLMNMGAVGKQMNNQMELNENNPVGDQNPDPKKTMKELQEQKMMENYITGMKGSPSDTLKQLQEQKLVESYIKNMDKGEQMDPIQMMMVMRMMENQGTGKENGFMDKMMQIQMMKSMQGGNQDSTVSRELADLKNQMAMNQLLQSANQKNAPTLQEQMTSLEKIRADRDVKIKEAEVNAQTYRDQALKATMDAKLQEMERQIEVARQTGGTLGAQRINEMKEEFKAIREMSAMLGDKEKGTGEAMMEGLGNVAEKALPALIELGKQKQQAPIAPPYQPPQEFYPNQQPIPSQGTPVPKSEIPPSEEEMAKIRDEMYLNPPPPEEPKK